MLDFLKAAKGVFTMDAAGLRFPGFLFVRRAGWVAIAIFATVFAAGKAQAQYLETRHVRDVVRDGVAQEVERFPETQALLMSVVGPVTDCLLKPPRRGSLRDPERSDGSPVS
jgi:hypothetical protein